MVEVRRTPGTQVAQGQRGYQRAAPIDFSPLAEPLNALRERIVKDQRERENFDLQQRLIKEANALQADFEQRRRDPNQDPFNFANVVDEEYARRAEAVVGEYRELGYDDDLVNNFATRLGAVRSGFFEAGLAHQIEAHQTRAYSQLDDLNVEYTQMVTNDPSLYEDVLSDAEVVFSNPDITYAQAQEWYDKNKQSVIMAGGKSAAIADPQGTLATLDPTGRWAQEQYAPVTGSAASVVAVGAQGEVSAALTEAGMSAPVVAGFLGNFDVEGGYGGALGDNGTASGIAQWRQERRANFKEQFGKEPHEATPAEQAQFVAWEMQNPAAAGMTVAQRDAILAAQTPEEAAELIDKYYERSSGEHRERRKEAAGKYIEVIDPGASTAPQAPPLVLPDGSAAPIGKEIGSAVTGVPLFDDMTGEQRLQVLAWAQQASERSMASQKAAMDILIQNVQSEALANGEVASPIPTQEEVLSTYGPVQGPQVWAELQTTISAGSHISKWKQLPAEAIAAHVATLRPTPGSPTFATEQQIYEGAQKAQAQLLKQRADDPAQYIMDTFPSVAEAAQKGLPEYYAEVRRAQKVLGLEGSSLFPKSVIDKEKDLYGTLTGAQRIAKMRQWRGGATEDEFMSMVRQLEGTKAYDDALIYELMRTQAGSEQLLPLIFEGRFKLETDPALRPSQSTINSNYRAEIFPALQSLNPRASSSINEAAIAIYVARGGPPGDAGTVFNATLYEESLRMAVGGIQGNNDTGWFIDTKNGVKDYTILPARVTGMQFERWKEGLTNRELTTLSETGEPPFYTTGERVSAQDIIDEGVFVLVTPGVYTIKFGPNEAALRPNGRPYLIRVGTADVRGRKGTTPTGRADPTPRIMN